MKNFFLFLFLVFISQSGSAQVEAPDLLCVKSDTLVWDIPINTCGPFNSYVIYGSTSFNGPYSIITNITNSTEDSYFHDSANNTTWYYYMTTDANCPGEPIITSDTLDSNPPDESSIVFIDIENGEVLLEWSASPSPEVIGYIIYRTTEIGTVPIDTVTNLSYTDLNANPNMQSENYFVIALDACGNTSLLINPHKTVFLSGEIESCEQSIYLNWERYIGWSAIEKQEVWASIDGDVPILLETLNGTDTSAVIPDLLDEKNYCFFLESYDAISGASSTSNEICLSVDIIADVRFLEMKNVSINNNNQPVVTWQWNQDAELSDYSISSSLDNNAFTIIESSAPPISLPLNNNYTDVNTPADTGPIYYKVNTTDQCGETKESNTGVSIHLVGQSSDNLQNNLSWTPFTLENATVSQYEVFRLTSTGSESIGIVDSDVFEISDPVDPTESSDAEICYRVVATSAVSLNGAAEETINTQSNTFCIEQPTGILAPNAFAPAGVNYEFRPLLIFGESAEYRMTIYDRWGQQIFETDDIKVGWNGRKGFREYPMGVYTYRIWVRQRSGREVEEVGMVTLVR
ncbi:MAG: gliding motility-associated C-terminal domain-containing protein [Saprospiraceae bacterium]